MSLTAVVQEFIEKYQLFDEHSHIVLGLSGGADSMALAHFLLINKYKFSVAHCNFQLRGEESNLDQQLVEKWCQENKVELQVKHFNTSEYANANKISIEMAARELRYNWFEELTEKLSAKCIAVAHHVNDQVETFFLNIMRGTGIRGYKGMLPSNGKVVRPFLQVNRSEIEEYIAQYNIPYRDDATNEDTTFIRNAIRHKIIPELEQVNPSFIETMNKNMQRLSGVWSFLKLHFDDMQERLVDQTRDFTKIKLPNDNEKHVFIDFLNYYFDRQVYSFPMSEIQSIIDGQVGKHLSHNGYVLTKERGFLSISTLYDASKMNLQVKEIPCSLELDNYKFEFKYVKPEGKQSIPVIPNKVWLKIDNDQLPLILRVWQPGDAMKPYGMNGTKKIKKMLTDAQVPSIQRKNYPVLCAEDEIVWLPVIRPHRKYIVTGKEEQVLEVRVLYNESIK
jgi:tRNA(Ile)-lysidine synthase